MGALLAAHHETWSTDRVYISMNAYWQEREDLSVPVEPNQNGGHDRRRRIEGCPASLYTLPSPRLLRDKFTPTIWT